MANETANTGNNGAMHIPGDRDFAALIDDLAARYADRFTREDIVARVASTRATIEAGSHHPEFVELLVAKAVRDQLAAEALAHGQSARAVPTLLFVCRHNEARSQMAAAFAERFGGDHVQVGSAGPSPSGSINPLVERAMAERGIALTRPYPVALTDDTLHTADVIVEIGVDLPQLPAKHHVHWKIVDPHGQPMDVVREARDAVEGHVRALLADLDVPIADA